VLSAQEELAMLRPELDGLQVIEILNVPAGRIVGAALDHLMEIRLEEGVLGDDEIRLRLIDWWEKNKNDAASMKGSSRPRR
jgi:poly(A) polymerase